MLKKLGKLSIVSRILCIGVLFYIWIMVSNSFLNIKGESGLIISTIVLAVIVFLFLFIIPNNIKKSNKQK